MLEIVRGGAAAFGLNLTDSQCERLVEFGEWLLVEGDRFGVTALTEPDRVARELLVDSLASAKLWDEGDALVDLGSGGGLPGVPLAIVRPDLSLTLLEATGKKCDFLRLTVEQFELNCKVEQRRAEAFGRDAGARERFDGVVAKAVAELASLIELAMPLLKVGGVLRAHKGPRVEEEVKLAGKALSELSARIEAVTPYPLEDKSYFLCQVRKLGPTAKRYPRRDGMPANKPLR